MGFDVGEHRIFVRSEERGRPTPDPDELKGYFLQFGEVLDVYKPGRTPDVAYITMAHAEEMQAVLTDPLVDIAGVMVTLQQAMPRGAGPGPPTSAASSPLAPPAAAASGEPARIYVTGLADELDVEILGSYFAYFGTVKDVYIPVDRQTGRKKPFAFVTMGSADDTNAVLAMGTHQLNDVHSVTVTAAEARQEWGAPPGGKGGTNMEAAPAAASPAYLGPPSVVQAAHRQPQTIAPRPHMSQVLASAYPQAPADDPSAGARLYVTQLTEAIDDEILRVYFTYFGPVKDVYIPTDRHTGYRKPFAFVTMTSAEDGANVLLHSSSHQITDQVSVNVTMAETRPPLRVGGYSGGGSGAFVPAAPAPQTTQDSGYFQWGAGSGKGGKGKEYQDVKQGIPGVNRLFVFGMPQGLNADMLRGHFARHGEILDIYIPPRTPDLAYITFCATEELQDAVLNSGLRIAGYTVQGLKEAHPKDAAKGKSKGRFEPY